jgi:hypothetical protein|tara:strand:+ start:122 stop:424 length:303 start_codon:yes stop_codon:yes gene_type:complete
MKRLFIILIISYSSTLFGQSTTKEVADSVCLCLDKKLKEAPDTNLLAILPSCIGTSMTPFMQELMKEHDLEAYTVENIHKIQLKIVAEVKERCKMVKIDE